jgi:uncharacterized protein (DUF362 family)
MKRRKFVKTSLAGIVAAGTLNGLDFLSAQNSYPDAVWVENGEPQQLFNAAMKEIGGLNRFINKGDVVVIKPNIGWDRAPEYAANTNPELIKSIVQECYQAGAKTVKIFDRTCNNEQRCYKNSMIQSMAEEAGADVSHMRKNKYVEIPISAGKAISSWPVYKDYIEADKVINVPIAKHHSLSRVSLGLKNLMGVMGGNRGSIHSGFNEKLIDIDKEILPTLTIIDAYRILTANGPQGGNLAHVKKTKTLIASSCLVTADFLALELFGHSLDSVGHIKEAVNRGINKFDLNKLNVKKVVLS